MTSGQLAKLLTRRALTAAQIAARVGCSKPTAYARIRALVRDGYTVVASKSRRRITGPVPIEYSVT